MKKKKVVRKKRKLHIPTEVDEYNERLERDVARGKISARRAPSRVRSLTPREAAAAPSQPPGRRKATPPPDFSLAYPKDKNFKVKKNPTGSVLRKTKGIKHVMEVFERTIKEQRQRMIYMRTDKEDPGPSFLIEAYALIAEWSAKVSKDFVEELSTLPTEGATPEELSGNVKRILHEAFRADDSTASMSARRWKMWPYRRHGSEVLPPKESDVSKQATKKKVATKKVSKISGKKTPGKKAAATKTAPKSATAVATADSRLRAVKDSKEPRMPERVKIKKAATGAGIKASTLMDKTKCSLRTINAMIGKGFLEVVG